MRRVKQAVIGRPMLVLADDLTGACESALTAAQAGCRAVVTLGGRVEGDWHLLATDLDVRDGRAVGVLPAPGSREPVLKIDSTLRGPIPELVERFAAATGAELLVVAPARPARGRVTRGGFQHLIGYEDAPVDVRARLGSVDGCEVVVADAEDDRDLDACVARADASGRRVGWVGSAGLVAALVRARLGERAVAGEVVPEPGPILVAAGSATEETAAQLAALSARPDVEMHGPASGGAAVAAALAAGRHVVVRGGSPHALAALAAEADRRLPLARLLLTGGATARGVCDALGIRVLEIVGEVAEGTPLGRTPVSERWVATKAGRFGTRDALSRAVDRLAGSTP
jgi:uncharacterized protein YgbK (DUF1537 family)